MGKNVCVVCGRNVARTINLPAGKIHLCDDIDCKDTFNFLVNGRSHPIVWAGLQDVENHETCHPDILKFYENNNDVAMTIANGVNDHLWDGQTMGEMYHEALEVAGQRLEMMFVGDVDDKELPLIDINIFKTEEAKLAFEKRLKGQP